MASNTKPMAQTVPLKESAQFMKARTTTTARETVIARTTAKEAERTMANSAVGEQTFPKTPVMKYDIQELQGLPPHRTPRKMVTAAERRTTMETVRSTPVGYCGSKRKSVPIPYMGHYAEATHLSASVKRRREASQYQNLENDDIEILDESEPESEGEFGDEPSPRGLHDSGREECGSSSPSPCVVRRGRDGRFVSNKRSRAAVKGWKNKKRVEDDSWTVKQMMPGGPVDGSVIPSFGGHVAKHLWEGVDRKVLKCENRERACNTLQIWREELSDDIKARLDATKLAHLPWSMFTHIDFPLISAFVERWQPDTNSFHLPFGEMTIMLHDVVQILHIPVEGHMVSAQASQTDLKFYLAELFAILPSSLGNNSPHWTGGGVPIDSIDELCRRRVPPRADNTCMTAYLFLLLGCTLFVDKSGCRVRPHDVVEATDQLGTIGDYSWGSATLAYLYRQLGIASRWDCGGIAGCLTLLQAWIYEYFPVFRPHQERNIIPSDCPRSCMWNVRSEDKSEHRLRFIRRRLDKMTASEVEWVPYGPNPSKEVPRTLLMCGYVRYRDIIEPYMPDRALRQLGYIQGIPIDIPRPVGAVRSEISAQYEVKYDAAHADWIWRAFPRVGRLDLSELKRHSSPSTCDSSYMSWFSQYSHPHVVNEKVEGSDKLPDQTCVDYWVGRAISIMKPLVEAKGQMPNEELKAACVEMDRFICLWNASLDNPNRIQPTEKITAGASIKSPLNLSHLKFTTKLNKSLPKSTREHSNTMPQRPEKEVEVDDCATYAATAVGAMSQNDYGQDGIDYSVHFVHSEDFFTVDAAVEWAKKVARRLGFFLVISSHKPQRDGRVAIYLACDRWVKKKPRDLEIVEQRNTKRKATGCRFRIKIIRRRGCDLWFIVTNSDASMHNHELFAY